MTKVVAKEPHPFDLTGDFLKGFTSGLYKWVFTLKAGNVVRDEARIIFAVESGEDIEPKPALKITLDDGRVTYWDLANDCRVDLPTSTLGLRSAPLQISCSLFPRSGHIKMEEETSRCDRYDISCDEYVATVAALRTVYRTMTPVWKFGQSSTPFEKTVTELSALTWLDEVFLREPVSASSITTIRGDGLYIPGPYYEYYARDQLEAYLIDLTIDPTLEKPYHALSLGHENYLDLRLSETYRGNNYGSGLDFYWDGRYYGLVDRKHGWSVDSHYAAPDHYSVNDSFNSSQILAYDVLYGGLDSSFTVLNSYGFPYQTDLGYSLAVGQVTDMPANNFILFLTNADVYHRMELRGSSVYYAFRYAIEDGTGKIKEASRLKGLESYLTQVKWLSVDHDIFDLSQMVQESRTRRREGLALETLWRFLRV